MTFARSMIRLAGAALLLMVLLFVFSAAALSEDADPVNFTIQVSPESLTGPGEVTVSLRVSNPTDTDMIAPVSLLDPDGKVVASFGDGGSCILRSGGTQPWEGKWMVTQEQLDAGKVAYTLNYHLEDDSGQLVELNREAAATIQFTGERVNLAVDRSIDPKVVRSGGQATVTYKLYNSGNVALTDIRVQENITKSAKTVKTLAPGETATVTFSSRIGNADLVSNASITYKAQGNAQTLKQTVEDAAIPLAKPNLKIELSSPGAGVNVGDPATLVITFINAGNVSYSNVTVTEAKRGEILTNLSIPAGATVTEQKEFILMEPTDFKVTATLPDNTGETKKLTSNEIRVGVFDPEKQLLMTLNLTSDQETVPQVPADVKFHLTVTNNSNIKAENISVSHGSTHIYTIPSLEPGENIVLDRDVRISQAGQFRFTASVKDTLNNTVTFDSNTIRIAYAPPTPAPTTVPVVTVAPPALVTASPADPLLSQGRSALMTAAVALGALFGCALVLFGVSTGVRLYRKGKSNAAYDHLDLAERRDYTEPADEEFTEAEDPAEAEAPVPAEDEEPISVLPHEKVLHSASEAAADAPAPESMPDTDGEGGYRVSRAAQETPSSPLGAQEKGEDSPLPLEQAEEPPAKAARRPRRSARREDGE